MEIGLSLGSNLGDRLTHLQEARNRIASIAAVRVLAQSPVYETEPVGVSRQHREKMFLNSVVILKTERSVESIFDEIGRIENEMGRKRAEDRSEPRTIDIDVLFADETVARSEKLTLPHPRWNERRFVAQPLADVRPGLVLPGETRTVSEILDSLPTAPTAVLFVADW